MKGPRSDRSMSQVKRQFSYRRPICPFISSTFVDFQAEREILVKKVFPNLDALCRERGTYCAPIDLRWGINDSQTKSGQIVQLCLDCIDRCAPFFICMLGERYGSHRPMDAAPLPASYQDLPPDGDWLDQNLLVAASAGYSWVLQDTFQHASVTELEIMQAAMLTDSEFAYFYFRQPDHVELLHTDLPDNERKEKLSRYESESEYSGWKMSDLKARIVKRGLPIRYFKTPEDLARIVLEDWRAVVNKLYPPLEDMLADIYTERFTEWMASETFAETRRRAFVKSSALTTLFNQMSDFAADAALAPSPGSDERESSSAAVYALRARLRPRRSTVVAYKSILNLVGERGCGKTTAIANWLKEFVDEQPGIKVFSHFVGSSALSLDVGAMMRRCALELRGSFHHTCSSCSSITNEEVSDIHRVVEAFRAAISLGPCVLVIDGVDEVGASYGRSPQKVKELNWLPRPLPPQCKVIITTVKSDAVHKVLAERPDAVTLAVPLLEEKSVRCEIIREHLAVHCKSLNKTQLNRIVNCRLSERPLFLMILSNELRMFGVYSRLDYHLNTYLEARSIRELWGRIINRWVQEYGWMNELSDTGSMAPAAEMEGWVADALRLISVSRHGLSQTEILDVLKLLDYRNDTEVTSFDWALFRSSAMDALFEKPGGLFGFFHQHFKEAVEYTLLGAVTPDYPAECGREAPASSSPQSILEALTSRGPDRKTFHEYLADYFLAIPHCPRRTDELPWHLHMCGDLDRLCDVVSEPRLFHELMADHPSSTRRFELIRYWQLLSSAGYDASDIYTQMIDTVLKMADMQGPSQNKLHDHNEDEDSALSDDGGTSPIGPPIYVLPPDDTIKRRPSTQDEEASLGFSELEDGRSLDPVTRTSGWQFDKPLSQMEIANVCKCAGEFLAELSQYDHAEQLLRLAHDKLNDHFPLKQVEQELLCDIEEQLANLYHHQLRLDEAHRWFDRALETIEDILNISMECAQNSKLIETKGRLLDQKGNILTCERRYSEAEQLLTEAECLMINAQSFRGIATVCYHMGFLRMGQKSFADADQFLRLALKKREVWYGKLHPLVAEVLNDLAGLLCHPLNTHRYDTCEAEVHYRRALSIRETCLGPSHILVATTLFNLGKLLKKEASTPARSEALVLLQRSLDLRTTLLGADHHFTRSVRRVLAELESEIRAQEKLGRSTTPQRPEGRCYSSLSWHDNDILQFESRENAKAGGQIRKKRSKTHEGGLRESVDSPRRLATPSPTTLGRRVSCDSIPASISNLTNNSPQFSPQPSPRNSSSSLSVHSTSGVVHRKTTLVAVPKPRSFSASPTQLVDSGPDVNNNQGLSTILKWAKEDNVARREEASKQQLDKNVAEGQGEETAEHERECTEDEYLETFENPPKKLIEKVGSPSVRNPGSPRQKMSIAKKRHSAPVSRMATTSGMTSSRGKVVHVMLPRRRAASAESSHQRNCQLPGPHEIEKHNTAILTGPNSTMTSLLGPPPCPRLRPNTVHHKSAWYHIPGRYPTNRAPFPHRRLQARVAIENSNMSMSPLLSRSCPQFHGSLRPESGRHSHQLIGYQGIASATARSMQQQLAREG